MNWLEITAGFGMGAFVGWTLSWWLYQRVHLRRSTALHNRFEGERQSLQNQLESARLQGTRHEIGRVTAETKLEATTELLAETKRQLESFRNGYAEALDQLRNQFRSLSAEALQQNQPQFLHLAQEVLNRILEGARSELSLREHRMEALVKPLRAELAAYQDHLAQSQTLQSSNLSELKAHLENLSHLSQSLSSETHHLRRVLSSSVTRGKWGEHTLRRVIEAAGMSTHCDFVEQADGGEGKPDLVVRLPGDRLIIVDAKVPEFEFLERLETAPADEHPKIKAEHAAKLRNTIKALADREYPRLFPTALEQVVLFMPAESLFSTALEGDPNLLVWALQKRVFLATPASLIALLRSVSMSWQQHRQTENARAILEAAQELYVRICRFAEHLDRIRGGLERATVAFNDSVGTYQRMVLPSGQKLAQLGMEETAGTLPDVGVLSTPLRTNPQIEGGPGSLQPEVIFEQTLSTKKPGKLP